MSIPAEGATTSLARSPEDAAALRQAPFVLGVLSFVYLVNTIDRQILSILLTRRWGLLRRAAARRSGLRRRRTLAIAGAQEIEMSIAGAPIGVHRRSLFGHPADAAC